MGENNDGADAELAAVAEAWLVEHWDPDLAVDDWWQLVADAGWTAPQFSPEHGGRGLGRRSQGVVRAAFARFGALQPPGGLGLLMAAPTIAAHGTPEQIARHVRPVLAGSVGWCQLFSEPGAGSDLAGLTTRAERDGDRWIINGQKVWSSMALTADYGMLIARTNPDVPKHRGISWFAFRLDQPGVTIRPLREMTGDAVFNEVFFDDAVVDDADLIGGEGNGWAVTNTTLMFERTGIGAGGTNVLFPPAGPKGGFFGNGRAGNAALMRPENVKLTLSYADLAPLAAKYGRSGDAIVRQDLARLYSYTCAGLWNAARGRAEMAKGGGQWAASVGKVSQTRIVKLAAALALDILGMEGQRADEGSEGAGAYAKAMVFSAASSIYGGTDQVQRNIIAERTLGLPKEPNEVADRNRPFRELPSNAVSGP